MHTTNWGLNELLLDIEFDTKKVLKALPSAHGALRYKQIEIH